MISNKSLKKYKTSFLSEILAGLTTFSSMAYILFVNPMILSLAGMDFGAVLTTSIIVTILATLSVGLLVNVPYAIAPGMGMSAFITFSMVLTNRSTWQEGLAAVFLASLFLLILTICKLRGKILSSMPKTLTHATVGGIGLFLIFVGLREVGIIIHNPGSLIAIDPSYRIEIGLALIGFIAIGIMLRFKIQAAFLLSLFLMWILAIYFHLSSFNGVFAWPPSLAPTFLHLDFSAYQTWNFWRFTLSLFLIALFDSTAGLVTLNKMLGRKLSDEEKHRLLYPDAATSMVSSLLGSGGLVFHLESATGIHAGGRTGLTSVIVAICFSFTFFFYPIIQAIPTFASTPILIVLGLMMLRELQYINWKSLSDLVPTLIVVLIMPLTFSVYYGFAFGFISFFLMKLICGKFKEITPLTGILALLFCLQMAIG